MNDGQKGFSSEGTTKIKINQSSGNAQQYIYLTSNSERVQVFDGDGTVFFILPPCRTMSIGDSFLFIETGYSTNGNIYVGSADNPTAFSMASGMPMLVTMFRYHSSESAAWKASLMVDQYTQSYINLLISNCVLKCDAAGNILFSQGISSITDGGTGKLTVTLTYAAGDANSYTVTSTLEAVATTYSVANDRKVRIVQGGQTAGAVDLVCTDSTATTNLVKDPTSWHVNIRKYF